MTDKNFHKLFTLYFIIFGVMITLSASIINYYLQVNEISKSLNKKAIDIFKINNEDILRNTIKNMDNTIKSLSNNQIIYDYIISGTNNKTNSQQIFLAIAVVMIVLCK